MAGINIIDGFKVNASAPVDYRIIASNSTDRDAISYKYDGLKVFLLNDRKTYTYNTTTATWSTDMSGTGNTLAMFGASGSNMVNSIVSQSVSGVNATLTISSPNTTILSTGTTSVVGALGGFILTLFPFSITYLKAGNVKLIGGQAFGSGYSGDVFISGGLPNGNTYLGYDGTNFVGKIGVKTNVFDTGIDYQIAPSTAYNNFVRFKQYTETTNNAFFYNNTISLTSSAFIRSTNAYSSPLTPDYTWYNNDQVGMYHPAANTIGFSIAGATAAVINSNKQVEINKITGSSLPSLAISGDLNTGISQINSLGADTISIIAGGIAKLTARTYELSASIHNTSGATGNHLNPSVGSGAYSPALSNSVNIASSFIGAFQWLRVGNVITVSGSIDITPTANATVTSVEIALPAPTVVVGAGAIAGAASSLNGSLNPTGIIGSISAVPNVRAKLAFVSGSTTNWTWLIHFTYLVADQSLSL